MRVKEIVLPALFAALVLTVWQLYVAVSGVSETTLPKPTSVVEAGWKLRHELAENGWVTTKEIALGYLLAVLIGALCGLVVHASRTVERAIYPWLVVSQVVPIPVIAPLIVLWGGFDLKPKVFVIALVSFFPVVANTLAGLRSTDQNLINLLHTLGASRRQRFLSVQLPTALPSLFTGLKISAVFATVGAVFAEWVGASEGLGHLILILNNQAATPETFAAVAVLAALGLGLFGAVRVVERFATPWQGAGSKTSK